MSKRVVNGVCGMAAVIVFALAAYVTTINLIEAYGSGPPYYGMTTNMDKWERPVGFLVGLNVVALILIVVLGRVARKNWQ
ncbi:hypothetical protein M8A51_21810 [Schlegelella sp. S2-27]|uniref:Uncharacterized protein n=1 Tax=Caldimonas mangrovi TaxID=2944811 RepID=A0ABT0YWG6_9BURK|nr:hypothetical protein [Caldimonas mangrovi]MCM5682173.1 hypothetical protein [Caldimonas mangrovi]